MATHENLDVWKLSIELVMMVYKLTDKFPRKEQYILESQIKRSVISIPSNIAEGAARRYNKEFVHFLYNAQGSLSELDTQMVIATNLGFVDINTAKPLIKEIRHKISGLIRYLNSIPDKERSTVNP